MKLTKLTKNAPIPVQPAQVPMPMLEEDNVIYADNHTLFIDEKPIMMEPARDEVGNIVEGYFEQTGGFTVYKLFIGDFLESGHGLQRIINALQGAKPEDILELHISSNGGFVHELIELYNLIDTTFYKSVTTYCNHGYSAGAMAFLLGEERVIYENSDWMMHSYSGGFVGKRDDMLTHLEHEDKRLQKFFNKIMEPYFTKKELKKMQKGKDFWMSSEEMLERGVATHIMVAGEVMPGFIYLEDLYPERKIKREKLEKKQQKKALKLQKKLELKALQETAASGKMNYAEI